MERNGAVIPDGLNKKLFKLLENMGYVMDAYFEKKDLPLLPIPREVMPDLINTLEDLVNDPEFWKAAEVLFPPLDPNDYSLSSLEQANPKTKEELRFLLENYIKLFNCFAKEN